MRPGGRPGGGPDEDSAPPAGPRSGVPAGAGGWSARLERWGRRAEDAVLALLLVAMILLASTQIVLRNLFDSGLVWADGLLRLMVLWLALIGAVAASRADRHISIDILSRFLPARARLASEVAVDAFTAAVCGLLAWHAWRFVADAREFGDTLLGDLPAWWFQLVLPVAFALMAWRYALYAGGRLVALASGRGTRAA